MTALTVPQTPAAPFGALVETQCQDCTAGVYDYAVAPDGSVWPVECEVCQGAGYLSVCPICGLAPTTDTDLCGCPSSDFTKTFSPALCKTCETDPAPAAVDGLCIGCIQDAAERFAHELNVRDAEAELKWAYSVGWLA